MRASLLWTSKRGYGLAEGPDSPVSREASLHTHAGPGDAAGGVLAEDEDSGDDEEPGDPDVADQESDADSDASSTPSEKPRA